VTFIAKSKFRQRPTRENSQRINTEIRVREVRVVDQDGTQLGILKIEDALKAAEERNLDLVEVAPTVTPPVCRILDYGKHKYTVAKKSQVAKKHQSIIRVKEIKMRPKIDTHDYDFKSGHVKRFLAQGHRVKVTIMFRGREMAHTYLGKAILDRLAADIELIATPENPARLEGRNMYMYFLAKPGAFATKTAPAAPQETTGKEENNA
jgi:translation initiation factor IF-3